MNTISEFIQNLDPAMIWIVIGIIFFISEIFIPGLVALFFGLGAWSLAIILFLVNTPIILSVQIIIFSVFSIVYLVIIRKKWKNYFFGEEKDKGGRDDDEFLNQKVPVIKDIIPPHSGEIRLKGSVWQAFSEEEIKTNTMVRIVKVEGIHFYVETIKE